MTNETTDNSEIVVETDSSLRDELVRAALKAVTTVVVTAVATYAIDKVKSARDARKTAKLTVIPTK